MSYQLMNELYSGIIRVEICIANPFSWFNGIFVRASGIKVNNFVKWDRQCQQRHTFNTFFIEITSRI